MNNLLLFFLFASTNATAGEVRIGDMPPNFKVAFIGDQGLSKDSKRVLNVIKVEGAQLLIVSGDFTYGDPGIETEEWDSNLTQALGANFPVLVSPGNHDESDWPNFQSHVQNRIDRLTGITCTGELGAKQTCLYKGLHIVLSGVGGEFESKSDAAYLRESLASSQLSWRICSWHKQQAKMQVGYKFDATGWDVYQACLKGGAMVVNAHEHSYGRTHLMSNFKKQTIVSKSNVLNLALGKSFVLQSGLGGKSIRGDGWFARAPWFAARYTSWNGAKYGAAFCTFNSEGRPDTAECYFKDIAGKVIDRYTLKNNIRF